MSVVEVETTLRHYFQKEGPITLDTTNSAEIAKTIGPDAGFKPGSEPMIGLLVEQALHDLSSEGVISVSKDRAEGTTALDYVPEMDVERPSSEPTFNHDHLFDPLDAAQIREEQLGNVLRLESDPENSETKAELDEVRALIDSLLQ